MTIEPNKGKKYRIFRFWKTDKVQVLPALSFGVVQAVFQNCLEGQCVNKGGLEQDAAVAVEEGGAVFPGTQCYCNSFALLLYFQSKSGGKRMKIDRLIGIITILLRNDQVTAPELAERFEVSRRTINRDIEDICRAGIPLVTTQGYGGGISISEGYKLDHALLTPEELHILFSGLKGLDSVSETPCSPLLAEKLSAGEIEAADTMVIDLASHYQKPLTPKITAIRKAIQSRRQISFWYYYEKGESHRTIEPYKLMFQWSAWYVWGYCLERQNFRLFKLNRLWSLETGPDAFAPRELPDLDLTQYFSAGGIHLRALFQEHQKYRLVEEYGPDCFRPGPKSTLLFERNFVSYSNMLEWVLSFGGQVEVLEPLQLRKDLRRQAEKMLEKYKEHDI